MMMMQIFMNKKMI